MVDPDTDTDAGILCTWQHCHTDTIAAVDINAEKQQVRVPPNYGLLTIVKHVPASTLTRNVDT